MSGAELRRFRHNNPGHLEEMLKKDSGLKGRPLVVTDTVFSMDGDRALLKDLASICSRYSALFLADEAHAVGVLGPGGRGLAAEAGLGEEEVIVMGTLGKAFGVSGAYLAGQKLLTSYLVNTCRSFIYSTAPPPPLLAAVSAALGIIRGAEDLRRRLLDMADRLRTCLGDLGLDTLCSSTQIVPAVMGDVERAVKFAARLREERVFAPAIRPPTVPEGTSRVRFSLTAALTEDCFQSLLAAAGRAVKEL
jgi:8-amino-7-oxononanoate synthase